MITSDEPVPYIEALRCLVCDAASVADSMPTTRPGRQGKRAVDAMWALLKEIELLMGTGDTETENRKVKVLLSKYARFYIRTIEYRVEQIVRFPNLPRFESL